MLGRRKALKAEGEEVVAKPLSVQERMSLLESEEVLLKYPVGLLQPFSRQELGRLKKRFVFLIPAGDTSRDLHLPLATVLQMPELRAQPFVPLVARLVLDRQESVNNVVSFSAFMTILAVFSVKQPLELKRKLLFDVYDRENKGYVSVDDFLRIITTVSRLNAAKHKMLRQDLGNHLEPFVKQAKAGVSGVLFSDFGQLIDDDAVLNTLTIAY